MALLLVMSSCGAARSSVAGAAGQAAVKWTRLAGAAGGPVWRIAFDPENPSTMFLGSDDGLIFKSVDGGQHFARMTVGVLGEQFRALAVSPVDSRIVVAFSSDVFGFDASFGGVYLSTDGGATWSFLKNQPVGTPFIGSSKVTHARGAAFDPTGRVLVLADEFLGIFRTTNQGATWTNPLPGTKAFVYGLFTDPNRARTLWAVGYDMANNEAGAIWRSLDFGQSWTEIPVPILDQTKSPLPYAVAVLPGTGKILFGWSGVDPASGATVGGVIASTDDGKTWADSSTGLPPDFSPGNEIVADPANSGLLYASANEMTYPDGLYRSTDFGASWQPVGQLIKGSDSLFTLAVRGGAAPAIFGGGDAFYESANQGKSWTLREAGLAAEAPRRVVADLHTASGLYGVMTEGLFHSSDNGHSWQPIGTWPGTRSLSAVAVDPVAASHTIYAATPDSLWRSGDGGGHWTALALPGSVPVSYLAADPLTANSVYAADAGHTVYRSQDGGATWHAAIVGPASDSFTAVPAPIVADPSASGILYAGMADGLWKSTDHGAVWTSLPGTTAGATIYSLAAVGDTTTRLYVSLPEKWPQDLQLSTDRGKTWTVLLDPPVEDRYALVAGAGAQPLVVAYGAYSGPGFVPAYVAAGVPTAWAALGSALGVGLGEVSLAGANLVLSADPRYESVAFSTPIASLPTPGWHSARRER